MASMQIVCPNCATSYDVQPAVLGAEGRSVRCARCRTVWHAIPEPAMAVAAAAADDAATAAEAHAAEDEAPAGEFDWSLGDEGEAHDAKPGAPDAAAKAEAAPAEGSAQGAVDDIFAAAGGETIEPGEAPSVVPTIDADVAAELRPAAELENIETVAARRAPKAKKERKWTWPRPGLRAAIVALAVILGALIAGRAKVVQFAPQTASLYGAIGLPVNLRGLVFENVRTTGEVHEGVPVLIVEGTIANSVNRTVDVPRLRFAMRNRTGQEIYAWTSVTGRSTLAPGETAAFRTRLASPPADGRDVSVRFLTRRDLLAGMR